MLRTINEKALRKLVKSLLEGETDVPIAANPNVEPLVNDTQLDYMEKTPVDHVELANIIASKLMKVDDKEAPIMYKKISDVIDVVSADNEKDKEMTEAEDKLRVIVRKMIREHGEDVKHPTPGPMSDDAEAVKKKKRAYTSAQEAGGSTFDEIAAEFGFEKPAGAAAAFERAKLKAKYLANLPNEDREFIVLSALDDYIKKLERERELSTADVEFLRAHPDVLAGMDKFRDHMKKFVDAGMRDAGIEVGPEVDDDDDFANPLNKSKGMR